MCNKKLISCILALLLGSFSVSSGDNIVVFNEIMYHPAADEAILEWVEFYNQLSYDMDISGWSVRGGIEFDFPEGTIVPGGGFLVLAISPADLEAQSGYAEAYGPFTGRLSNAGEEFRLLNNSERIMDVIDYRDGGDWPVPPDGSGVSLAKIDSDTANEPPKNWTWSEQVDGTPGEHNFSGAQPPDQLVINEITAATESPFWVEIFNPGETTVDLTGFVLACAGDVTGEYIFGAQSIDPNHYLVINETTLGFHPIDEDKLFLYKAGKTSVFDGRTVKNRLRGQSMEHNGRWLYPSDPTPGSANSFDFHDEIVINEIMYHQRSSAADTPATYETTTLIPSVATAATLVPTDGNLGLTWTGGNEPFNDSGWTHGTGNTTGIGYDTDTTYDYLINTDLEGLMDGKTCFYTRIAFDVTDPQTINTLNLKMKYDDGFVAYINGVEVARRNLIGETPAWDSTAYEHFDGDAQVFEPIDISAFISVLQPGQNILAIHGINSSSTSSDMLILPELENTTELTPFIPRGESPEAWVELYNRSDTIVDMSGWKIRGGIEFDFPADTVIPAGGYLVVADNAEYLQSLYPGLTNIIGDFSGNLSHKNDLIVLKDADDNPADELLYFDEGRWSSYADGYNATLELRDPRADNSKPEAWAASDEAVKTQWKTYTYCKTPVSSIGPDWKWNELIIGLLQEGELLLDDISIIEDPCGAAIQLIQNGSFETTPGDDKWRIIGNHRTSQVIVDPNDQGNHVLHLIATGPTEHMHNHAETTYANGQTINNDLDYEISFRAKWLGGTNKFHTRLYFNRLPKVTMIDVPELNGTPGTQNSRYESNIGPTFSDFGHSPVVPSIGQSVTVSVVARDPNGIDSCTLWWAVDGVGWNSQLMDHQGDGLYTSVIPGQPESTVVQFYLEAMDGLGAISTYPAAGMDSRALYKVYDAQSATNGLHNFRIIMTSGDAVFMHTTTNLMSNERLGGTIVYNDQKSYYDVGIRLRGSQRGRVTDFRLGFNVRFNADELFQGVHRTVSIDRSEEAYIGQREMLFNLMMNHAGGQISKYSDLIKVIAPLPQHTSTAELQLARFRDPFLDAQFDNGSDGTAFEYELIYYPLTTQDSTSEGLKLPAPDDIIGTIITDLGDDKENYRWNFLIKNNRNWDDYDALMTFAKGFGLSGASFNNIVSDIIDVDQWLRSMALGMLDGCGDNFVAGSPHNAMFYVRPEDQRVLFFPHDMDRNWQVYRPLITNNIYLQKIIAVPAYERLYYGHVQDILTTSYNSTYMSYWTDLFGSLLPAQNFSSHLTFISQRSNYISGELASAMPPALPFQITTNGGADFIVDSAAATLAGDGWINVRQIRLSGSDESLDTTWTDIDSWQVTLPLNPGENSFTLEAYDFQGNFIGSDSITVTSTLAERPLRDYLRVTELMYDPMGGSEYEYIELCNTGPNTLDVSNVFIPDGVDFDFATSTVSSLLPGEYVVIVSNIPTFESRYGTGINIAGEYDKNLSNDGEHVELHAAYSGYDTDIFDFTYDDSRGWPLAADGPGHSLVPVTSAIPGQDLGTMDYGANWRISMYINGSPGQTDPTSPATVVINEIMAHTDYFIPPYESNDWIELYNPTDSIITLTAGDWYLSDDDDEDTLTKWAIPTTVIPAYGRIVFDEVTGFHNPITEGFGLNKSGEEVVLSYLPGDSSDRVVDAVEFKGQEESVSLGRYPDGGDYWVHMTPTANGSNSAPIEHVVISEIMYNPLTDASEYVELYNPTALPIILYDAATSTGWRLDGAVGYSFASGVTIPAYEYLLVVGFDPTDPVLLADFEADYDDVTVQIFGPYSDSLNNRGERLALEKPEAPDDIGQPVSWVIVDEAIYFYQWPWPIEADGTGESLQRFDTVLSGNAPDSWVSADPSPGRHFVLTADFDSDGDVDFFDFIMFASVWISQEGEPGWDPIYNIAKPADTIIDMKDLVELAEQWFK